MPKPLNASALVDRLQSLRPSRQAILRYLKQGGIAVIAFGSLYVIAPPLWNAISVSPQQRVEPLERRLNDLDKQIKASPTPSTADLKEIATLEKGRIDSENTIRTSLFQAVGGLLVFVTLYISWLTLKANEAKQVAERFSKAAEQLGNDNIHVRLGGIYALEQIAKDAEEKYYWQVIETLTSYVRERSPYPPKAAKTHSSFVQAAIDAIKNGITYNEEDISPLSTDIQAVMTVLARRNYTHGHRLERYRLDLHSTDLRRLQLPPDAQLNQANLSETNLQGAILRGVQLQGALLREANLQGASLFGAKLQRVNLWRANLQEVNFGVANLQGATLAEAKLQKAFLRGANLRRANLLKANLQGALLRGVNLQGADLGGSNLHKVRLREANLRSILLQETISQDAKFKKSFLLQGTQFKIEAVGLTWEQLDTAASYEGAILPSYLQPQPQQSQTETAQSAKQATESVQAEGEITAIPPEGTQLAPPES